MPSGPTLIPMDFDIDAEFSNQTMAPELQHKFDPTVRHNVRPECTLTRQRKRDTRLEMLAIRQFQLC
jgi:hypothetical protein